MSDPDPLEEKTVAFEKEHGASALLKLSMSALNRLMVDKKIITAAELRASMERELAQEYKTMWAVIFPDGRVVTGSDCNSEEAAWRIALGCPGDLEIEDAKQSGVRAVKATLRYPKKT